MSLTIEKRAREIETKLKDEILPLVNSLRLQMHGPDEHADKAVHELGEDLRACVGGAINFADMIADNGETENDSPRAVAGQP